MVSVKEFSWEEVSAPDFGNPARQAWRDAVAEIAEKAKATLPQCNGRVESAVKMVLAGDVELLEGGKARVASQSNGSTAYFVVNGTCECRDFAKAPSGWCKHRIAAGMQKRAHALAKATLDAGPNGQAAPVSHDSPVVEAQVWRSNIAPVREDLEKPAAAGAALPEAAFSLCLKGRLAGQDAQLTVRGQTIEEFQRNVAAVRELLDVLTDMPAGEGKDAPDAPTAGEDWCALHSTVMHWHDGEPNGWYSHKTADGWCKGRLPQRGR